MGGCQRVGGDERAATSSVPTDRSAHGYTHHINGAGASADDRYLLPKFAAQWLLGGQASAGPRPATLQDVRGILLSDPERARLRRAEYNRIHEALANLYESCLPPLEEKYVKRPEDSHNWWWERFKPWDKSHSEEGGAGMYGQPQLVPGWNGKMHMGRMRWRVVAREQVKLQFWRKSECEDESRELLLLVAEDEHWRATMPVPLIANFLERRDCEFSRDFLVGAGRTVVDVNIVTTRTQQYSTVCRKERFKDVL